MNVYWHNSMQQKLSRSYQRLKTFLKPERAFITSVACLIMLLPTLTETDQTGGIASLCLWM